MCRKHPAAHWGQTPPAQVLLLLSPHSEQQPAPALLACDSRLHAWHSSRHTRPFGEAGSPSFRALVAGRTATPASAHTLQPGAPASPGPLAGSLKGALRHPRLRRAPEDAPPMACLDAAWRLALSASGPFGASPRPRASQPASTVLRPSLATAFLDHVPQCTPCRLPESAPGPQSCTLAAHQLRSARPRCRAPARGCPHQGGPVPLGASAAMARRADGQQRPPAARTVAAWSPRGCTPSRARLKRRSYHGTGPLPGSPRAGLAPGGPWTDNVCMFHVITYFAGLI